MKSYSLLFVVAVIGVLNAWSSTCKAATISGRVLSGGKPVQLASITLSATNFGAVSDTAGYFSMENIPGGSYQLHVTCIGYADYTKAFSIKSNEYLSLPVSLVTTNTMLNEVVVTGVSRTTLIRENPVAIVSVAPKKIERTNESNIIDVLVKNTPGLHAVKTGPNVSKPFIRGLGYNRVLTLYDGIRQEGQQWGDEHSIEVDAYNIEKAEVIKGPASLMYGSDALAGVVSLFPFIPNDNNQKWHGRLISEYQTNNNLIGNGFMLGYNGRHLLFSVRGSYRLAKNYRNAVDGAVYNTNFREKNISLLIGYKTSKGFSHYNVSLYDNLQGIPDGSRDSLTRRFTKQIYEGDKDAIANRPVVTDEELNTYRLSPLHQHIQHYRMYMHHSYALGSGDMDVLLAWQQNVRKEYNHPTMPQQAGMYVRLNTINYGLRYNAPKVANFETTIGINGMLQQNKSINATDFPIPDYNLADGGIYVYEKWKYNKWSISGGVRYDIRQVQWNDFYVQTNTETGFGKHANPPDTVNATLQFPAYKKIFAGISASAGATFQWTKSISIKANIGRGYRAPNITEIASNGLDPGAHIIYLGNRSFKPEFSLQEDIGVIARFKNISADVSFFNNNIKNYIYLSMLVDAAGNPVTDAQGNKTYQYQQASAQLYGMEMWFSVHSEKWKGFNFDNSLATVYGYNRKAMYKGKGINGAYLPLIPPLKILSSISQVIELQSKVVNTLTPKIEMEYSATQNRFLGLNNTETKTSGYTLFNIGVAAEKKLANNKSLELQLQVNNLFNIAYQSNLSRLKYFEYYSQSPNGHYGIYNMGRNICMKMILPF